MCLAQPGPRCYSHAHTDYLIAYKKLDKFITRNTPVENVEKTLDKLDKQRKNGSISSKAYERATKELEYFVSTKKALETKAKQALIAADCTKQGIENLRAEIASLESSDDNESKTKKLRKLQARLKNATTSYEAKMSRYDVLHGTVNARKPSNYGTAAGIAELDSRYRSAVLAGADKEQLESLQKKKEHAVATERKVSAGEIRLTESQKQSQWRPVPQKVAEKTADDHYNDYLRYRQMADSAEGKLTREINMVERFGADDMTKINALKSKLAKCRERRDEARAMVISMRGAA